MMCDFMNHATKGCGSARERVSPVELKRIRDIHERPILSFGGATPPSGRSLDDGVLLRALAVAQDRNKLHGIVVASII